MQRFGASAAGVQQFLWLRSTSGTLLADWRVLALEFGTSRRWFLDRIQELIADDQVLVARTGANVRLDRWTVRRPPGLEAEMDESPPHRTTGSGVEDQTPDPDEEFDVTGHEHPNRRSANGGDWHYHAWGSTPHDHMLRAVCARPECADSPTHNIHQS